MLDLTPLQLGLTLSRRKYQHFCSKSGAAGAPDLPYCGPQSQTLGSKSLTEKAICWVSQAQKVVGPLRPLGEIDACADGSLQYVR